jgi:hypothetical protein
MAQTPVHPREEYVEQAYFFRAWRERSSEGRAAQEILAQLDQEILATTKLPFAIQFMLAELRHSGQISQACARLAHYFTPFQSFVLEQAESDAARMPFEQALLILEREAIYRAQGPTSAGLFIFEVEAMSRNRLGYVDGFARMQGDACFDPDWREYLGLVQTQLGLRDLPELVFARSESYVMERRRSDPDYEPPFAVLFNEKEGRIAGANIGRDPMYFFAALQRQLGYPEVPRPPKEETLFRRLDGLSRSIQRIEERMKILEQEIRGQVDLAPFTIDKEGAAPIDKRIEPGE